GAALFQQREEIIAIAAFAKRFGERDKLIGGDEFLLKRNLFRAGYFKPLSFLDRLHELRGFQKIVMRAGIEPGAATAEQFHAELAPLKIKPVKIGNLKLAARARFQAFRKVHNLIVIEIEPRNGEVGF